MKKLPELPQEITLAIGTSASHKLIDYLDQILSHQKQDIIAVSVDKFENKLTQEVSGLKLDFAELRADNAEFQSRMTSEFGQLRTEFAELRGETRAGISELRAEMKADFAGVQKEFAEVHKQISGLHEKISDVHRQISVQTKWLVASLLLAVALYPVITKLVSRLM